MSKNNSRILAIDPGTKWMGVAFMENEQLVYHTVKVIKRGKSPHENLQNARKAVLRLIRDYQPNTLVVEKVFFANNRHGSLMKVLFEEIKAIAKRKGLKFISFAPSSMKKYISGNGWANKYEIAYAVTKKYPELKVYLTQDREWKERFHQNMFDAVALGMMANKKTV